MEIKKIVVVGGGFAGVNLVKNLANEPDFQITLVDINNYHFFPPLLYQVATAFIETANITYPFRKMFQNKGNVRFHNGKLLNINPSENMIETDAGTMFYDYLVLAMGTETNFRDSKNIAQLAMPMKNIDDAIRLRNKLLLNMEKASRAQDENVIEPLTNLVIAGGGPTGVELAGMMAEMGRKILVKDYPEIKKEWGNIYLVNSGKNLLAPMSASSQKEAYKTLDKLGVIIKLETSVSDFVNNEVLLSNGEKIKSSTLIWASGVIARNVPGLPDESVGKSKRIIVNEYNLVNQTANIFAIGDLCIHTTDEKYPEGHPQLAQVAIQQGTLLAENLKHIINGRSPRSFVYKDKGSMAIISKYNAVVDLPNGFFKGYFAWLAWLFIHLIPIAGFRNKMKVSYNWLWSFMTNDPALRVIIRPEKENIKQTSS